MRCVVTGNECRETPEELVRQAIARELMRRYGYRKENMRLELPIQMGSSSNRRADIAIFRPETAERTQHTAYIIVECKRADVHDAGFEAARDQLKSYMAASTNAHFGMVVAGSRRVCHRKVKHDAHGHYEFVEVPDIPSVTAPRPRFTVVRAAPAQSFYGQHPPEPTPSHHLSPPARSIGAKLLPVLVLSGVLATVILGGTCAAALAWRSKADSTAPGNGLPAAAPPSPAGNPGGPSKQIIPRTRTATPKLAEWAAVSATDPRLIPVGCYRKIIREWLKLNCASQASPKAITGVRDMGTEGTDYFKWEKPGSVVDLVARMVPGRRGEAVLEVAGESVVVGYDWRNTRQPPLLIWESQ